MINTHIFYFIIFYLFKYSIIKGRINTTTTYVKLNYIIHVYTVGNYATLDDSKIVHNVPSEHINMNYNRFQDGTL